MAPLWYPLLVRGDSALAKSVPHKFNKHVVVCRQNEGGTRLFTQFESFVEYYGHYFYDIAPEERRDYEVIYGGARQKLYFDFDLAADAVIGVSPADIDASVRRFVAVLHERVFAEEGSGVRVLVFSSSSPKKYSYHLVVCGVAFASHTEVAAAAHFTMEEAAHAESEVALNRAVLDSVDLAVYKSTQQLRVVGSRKAASAREKVYRADLSTAPAYAEIGVPPSAEPGAPAPHVKLFMDSLVTEMSSSREPDARGLLAREVARRTTLPRRGVAAWSSGGAAWSGGEEAANKAVARLLAHVERVYNVGVPFVVRDGTEPASRNGATFVRLDRTAPSMCPTCDHVHDHENPFVVLTEEYAYFKCGRNTTTAPPRICLVDPPAGALSQKLLARANTTVPGAELKPSVNRRLAQLNFELECDTLAPTLTHCAANTPPASPEPIHPPPRAAPSSAGAKRRSQRSSAPSHLATASTRSPASTRSSAKFTRGAAARTLNAVNSRTLQRRLCAFKDAPEHLLK